MRVRLALLIMLTGVSSAGLSFAGPTGTAAAPRVATSRATGPSKTAKTAPTAAHETATHEPATVDEHATLPSTLVLAHAVPAGATAQRVVPARLVTPRPTALLAHGEAAPAAVEPTSLHGATPAAATHEAAPTTTFVRNGVRDPARDGSNGGQWFKDAHGGDWFGKPGKGDAQELDRMGNEHATAGIYRLASDTFGTSAPELRIANVDGKPFLMSKKIALSDAKSFTDEQLKRFGDGFVVDAWMANWDIGGAWQLTADAAGKPVRVDGGGAGLFRARGEPKGAAFGEEVTELQTMRDPLRSISYGFRKVTERDVKEQLQKFAGWYPAHHAEVDAAIDGTAMSPAAATVLKAKLAARAQWLITQSKK